MTSVSSVAMCFVFLLVSCALSAHATTLRGQTARRVNHQLKSGGGHRGKSQAIADKSEYDDDGDNDEEPDAYESDSQEEASEEQVATEVGQGSEEKEPPQDATAQGTVPKEDRMAAEAKTQLAVTAARKELDMTTQQLAELRARKAHLENTHESDKEIDSSVRLVSNETESPAMAGMLGNMWKEMRMFEMPMYSKHLEDKMQALQVKQNQEELELSNARTFLAGVDTATEAPVISTPAVSTTLLAAPAPAAPAPEKQEPWQPWWKVRRLEALLGGLIYIVFGIIAAYIFSLYRSTKDFVDVPTKRGATWTFRLFPGLFANRKIGITGFLCPCLRWADTVDRADTGLTYWPAFMLMFFLMFLNSYSYGIASLAIIVVGVIFRQKLRRKYNLKPGKAESYAEDIAVWCCCTPCAIIQEANEVSVHH